jgi:hypothetical protein
VNRVLLVALVVLATITTRARGEDEQHPSYRVVVDRVELEPSTLTGARLRVYLSALSIEGQRLDLTEPKSIRMFVGPGEKQLPHALGTYDASGGATAVVVVLQVSLDLADALPAITDALDRDLLATLGDRAQVAILPYGETVGAGKLEKPRLARAQLAAIATDNSAGEPVMVDAVERALILLRKLGADPSVRKMIVLIGDGRDRGSDRERVTAVGKRAAKLGVRIHTIAYSPADVRRPLLALGELAKQSLGTFRWPGRGHKPTADSWSEAFKQLHEEIAKQYVITYFVGADDDVAGKKLHVVTSGRTEATSNEVRIPDTASCAGAACETGYCGAGRCIVPAGERGRGVLGWVAIVGGGVVASVVVLGFIGFVMTRRAQRAAAPDPVPVTAAPAVAAPVAVAPPPALLVMNGPLAGHRALIHNGFLIGTQPGCHLVLEDGFASSQHAQIGIDAQGSCRLYDRGSTNGTFLNGVPVRESALEHGATIRIGTTELRFLAE